MTPDQLALLADARLSREARIMALHVSTLGEGGHAIPHGDFRRLLGRGPRGMAKDDTLAGYVQELVEYGWIERDPGGRGSPVYTFSPPTKGEETDDVYPTPRGDQKFSPPTKGDQNGRLPPHHGGAEDPSRARASSTSLPPPPPPLQARVREFVTQSDALVGCRDSLIDYLTERVEPSHQLGYAQSLAGIVEGTDEHTWMLPDGGHLHDGRAQIIAGCLNELRAGDEVGKYFPGPPGDVRNVKSKIRHRVKSIAGAERDAARKRETRADAAAGAGKARREYKTPDVHPES